MQDFEYEYHLTDIKDLSKEDQLKLQVYEMDVFDNIDLGKYKKRIAYDG